MASLLEAERDGRIGSRALPCEDECKNDGKDSQQEGYNKEARSATRERQLVPLVFCAKQRS